MYNPVHVDILTHDLRGASRFWSELFRWELLRLPHAPMAFMETSEGPGGALVQIRPEQAARVLIQINVPRCAEVAAQVVARGGRVLLERASLGRGTFAIVEDPWGNALAIVEGFSEGMLCLDVGWGPSFRRVELCVDALDEGMRFYRALFGWSFAVEPSQRASANLVRDGQRGVEISLVTPERAYQRGVMLFMEVEDVRAMWRRMSRLGVRPVRPLHIHPSLGLCVSFTDPDGHTITLCNTRQRLQHHPLAVRPELQLLRA